MKEENEKFEHDMWYANMGINPKDENAVRFCQKPYDPDAAKASKFLKRKRRHQESKDFAKFRLHTSSS